MIVIDWISTPNHRNFNRAFFGAIKQQITSCLVFSEKLVIPEVRCELLEASETRFRKALYILKLILVYRNSNILLLTYDPLFLPLMLLIKRQIIVFEHNTTPEEGSWVKVLWQRMLYRKVRRLAQFPGQYERLATLGQNVTYIGSPLQKIDMKYSVRGSSSNSNVYAAPSCRADVELVYKYAHLFAGSEIVVKRLSGGKSDTSESLSVKLTSVDRIEFQYSGKPLDAILVTVDSSIRGTGWFNEAISNNIPIVILNPKALQLFIETFPKYPFVDIANLNGSNDFKKELKAIEMISKYNYVCKHNSMINKRFVRVIHDLNIDNRHNDG